MIITFYPKSINIDKDDVLDEIVPSPKQNLSDFKEFKESDFDFFVYRAHILSSDKKGPTYIANKSLSSPKASTNEG